MSDAIAETGRTYDVIAAEYARRTSMLDSQLLDTIRELAAGLGAADPAGGPLVADVGCGPGHETALLRAHGCRVIGLDLSIGQLRTGGLPGVVQADMRRLPLRTGSVDVLWCLAAMLHIPRRLVPGVLAEFARCVRAGGELYLFVAEGDGEGWEATSGYDVSLRRWFTYHRAPELTALIVAAGFEVHRLSRVSSNRDWLVLRARRA